MKKSLITLAVALVLVVSFAVAASAQNFAWRTVTLNQLSQGADVFYVNMTHDYANDPSGTYTAPQFTNKWFKCSNVTKQKELLALVLTMISSGGTMTIKGEVGGWNTATGDVRSFSVVK